MAEIGPGPWVIIAAAILITGGAVALVIWNQTRGKGPGSNVPASSGAGENCVGSNLADPPLSSPYCNKAPNTSPQPTPQDRLTFRENLQAFSDVQAIEARLKEYDHGTPVAPSGNRPRRITRDEVLGRNGQRMMRGSVQGY